ncbi:SGNH/GDSL hydrolase family protein [Urechidicola vernalis]|uniref:SGNH/GDSL hydrolase family protein n=1 Tax=Urechidicola vernalis TaxID=3075600 RepID=A0ABU2Y6F9_9FLAO|nr:SGNH/GDSL hydrolase family protein [Urechidicola sp. P050]MDT0553791.1 SGNH/GDSL hydrolase family protein [Urechidicola sp. P050]
MKLKSLKTYKKLLYLGVFLVYMVGMENVNAQDWANLESFKEANAPFLNGDKDDPEVVFMGNSITIGWYNTNPDFFNTNNFVNRGIGGQTTPQMLVRFRPDVIDLKPKVVVILAGTNDIAGNTGPSTIKMIADNIFSMCEIAEANDIKVVISSVLPVYDYPWKPGLEPAQKIIDLNLLLKEYAAKNGHEYLDYFSSMVDERNGLITEYGYDGVHPNNEGYNVMTELVQKSLKKVIK